MLSEETRAPQMMGVRTYMMIGTNHVYQLNCPYFVGMQSYHEFGMTLDDPSASPSSLDSALFFVLGAFVLNVIVVMLAVCYFDPTTTKPPLLHRFAN